MAMSWQRFEYHTRVEVPCPPFVDFCTQGSIAAYCLWYSCQFIVAEMSESVDKKKWVEWARMAEQIERYEDMAEYMKKAAEQLHKDGPPFSPEERNLFSVAYKNAVGSRRSAWRILSTFEQRQDSDEKKALIAEYKCKLEAELEKICKEVLVGGVCHVLVREGMVGMCFAPYP